MKPYFHLQLNMTNRKLSEMGIHPVLGYMVVGVGFVLISIYLFQRTEFAGYVMLLTALSLLVKTAEITRCEFLKTVFGDGKYQLVRILENVLISLPFLAILVFEKAFIEAGLLLTGSVLLAMVSFKVSFNSSLPTPFHKKPFEFLTGFRKTFYLIPFAYIVTGIAIYVDNFNLGLFGLLLPFLLSLSYYAKPEHEYFVWSFAATPAQFLLEKLKTASIYASFLPTPILVALLVFYPLQAEYLLLAILAGVGFLWTVILAKYSAYPNEMGLGEGIVIASAIYFPPLLLVLIPYFYTKSIKKLSILLR